MENVLGVIYDWFQSFYGLYLSYFLWGYDPQANAYTNPNLYNVIGLITLAVPLLFVILFYYVIDHPKYCKWWSWLITMGVSGLTALFIGYGFVYSKLVSGAIPSSLVYQLDADGNVLAQLISESHCWYFGIANAIVAMMLFVVFTLIFKWKSNGSKYVPF